MRITVTSLPVCISGYVRSFWKIPSLVGRADQHLSGKLISCHLGLLGWFSRANFRAKVHCFHVLRRWGFYILASNVVNYVGSHLKFQTGRLADSEMCYILFGEWCWKSWTSLVSNLDFCKFWPISLARIGLFEKFPHPKNGFYLLVFRCGFQFDYSATFYGFNICQTFVPNITNSRGTLPVFPGIKNFQQNRNFVNLHPLQ